MAFVFFCEIAAVIYAGNEIAIQTDKLSYCVFESNWTHMSAKYRKLVVITGEQWRKPRVLAIGKIFLLRMNLLTSVSCNVWEMRASNIFHKINFNFAV